MKIAVVGASNQTEKYGYRIVRHLIDEGHLVFVRFLNSLTIHVSNCQSQHSQAGVAQLDEPIVDRIT